MSSNVSDAIDFSSDEIYDQYQSYRKLKKPINELLDTAVKYYLQSEYEEVRDLLTSFAQSEPTAYQFVTMGSYLEISNNENNGFEQDLSDNEEVYEVLKNISEEYSVLEESLIAVYMQIFAGRINPISSYNSSVEYNETSKEPMMTYELMSGNVLIFHTKVAASVGLSLSTSLLLAASESVNKALEDDLEISEEEKEGIIMGIDVLQEEIEELREVLDETK
ncbi:hypothetical protein EGH24_07920 [Halonotius terrestris]|uniref:Uncharacterized protein n=1 Tax=Halonotius terrestris TaxID=2487750 RepID=A0A8J8P8P7_9EURY|nr:hypothetical protein [Halonotius terrestris]TQQ81064.1 hypothetical protein EGH24_07920 [Halonotius terrestris]